MPACRASLASRTRPASSSTRERSRDVSEEVRGIPLVVPGHELLLDATEDLGQASSLGEGLHRLLGPRELEREHAAAEVYGALLGCGEGVEVLHGSFEPLPRRRQ